MRERVCAVMALLYIVLLVLNTTTIALGGSPWIPLMTTIFGGFFLVTAAILTTARRQS